MWLTDIVTHWDAVIVDFAVLYRIDLYDPQVLARPWLGVRTMLWALIHEPSSRLRRALTVEVNDDADRS